MGYFPNASAHVSYEQTVCAKCRNFRGEDGPLCAVMHLHAEFNYDQLDKDEASKARRALLDELIPVNPKTGMNKYCRMFNSIDNQGEFVFHLARGTASPEQLVNVIRALEGAVKYYAKPGDGMELTLIEKPNGQELF